MFLQSSNVHTKVTSLYHTFSLMMAQSWAESTSEITNYGRFINQFPLNIIRSIRQFERINKKYVDKKCLLCSIKYIYTYFWTHTCSYFLVTFWYIWSRRKLTVSKTNIKGVLIYLWYCMWKLSFTQMLVDIEHTENTKCLYLKYGGWNISR